MFSFVKVGATVGLVIGTAVMTHQTKMLNWEKLVTLDRTNTLQLQIKVGDCRTNRIQSHPV